MKLSADPAGCVIADSFIKSEGLNCCVFTSFAIWTSSELWECDANWPWCTHRTSKAFSPHATAGLHSEVISLPQTAESCYTHLKFSCRPREIRSTLLCVEWVIWCRTLNNMDGKLRFIFLFYRAVFCNCELRWMHIYSCQELGWLGF